MQFLLQGCAEQVVASDFSPQGNPPCRPSCCTCRCRCMIPPSQSAEHSLQPPQSPMTQSTGHGFGLQALCDSSGGHAAPFCGWATTVRVILCTPPPQVTEHASTTHSETSQSWTVSLSVTWTNDELTIFSSARNLRSPHTSVSEASFQALHSASVLFISSFAFLCSLSLSRSSPSAALSSAVEEATIACSSLSLCFRDCI
mmetsp:Transcript_69499/g.166593  ORF Transcript_69499/g.166593 Transcript_69499/m.166593 type:complete len:200 (-) Transcript_69499:1023-1622(-)